MSVGTESIKRAASKAAGEESNVEKEAVQAEKTTQTKAKKTTTKKKTSTVKKSVIPSVSPQVAEGMRLTGQERYQTGDELPTYLL